LRSVRRQPEPIREEFIELAACQRRVTEQDALDVGGVGLRESTVNKRRLARAGFAEEQRQPARRRKTVAQIAERFTVAGRQEQKPWVRHQIKGPLAQVEECLVHGYCR
jgi:hypothetical protein